MSPNLEYLPLFIFVLTLTYKKKKKRKATEKKTNPQQQKECFGVGEGVVHQPICHTMLWGLDPGMSVAQGNASCVHSNVWMGHSGIDGFGADSVLSWAYRDTPLAALSYYVARLSNASCLDQRDTRRS